jgi:WD40 repeat protein
MRVFVCGEMGKAILYDISMGARSQQSTDGKLLSLPKDQTEWAVLKDWFTAHHIVSSQPKYVNTVKFSKTAGFYVTGCSNGEVKLWSARDCAQLGTLNGQQWVDRAIRENL